MYTEGFKNQKNVAYSLVSSDLVSLLELRFSAKVVRGREHSILTN